MSIRQDGDTLYVSAPTVVKKRPQIVLDSACITYTHNNRLLGSASSDGSILRVLHHTKVVVEKVIPPVTLTLTPREAVAVYDVLFNEVTGETDRVQDALHDWGEANNVGLEVSISNRTRIESHKIDAGKLDKVLNGTS